MCGRGGGIGVRGRRGCGAVVVACGGTRGSGVMESETLCRGDCWSSSVEEKGSWKSGGKGGVVARVC